VLAASRALREAEERWAALRPGEEFVVDWPEHRPRRPAQHAGADRGSRRDRGRRQRSRWPRV